MSETTKHRCAFCYDREQGKHGEIKREWSSDWLMFIPVCREHTVEDGTFNSKHLAINETGFNDY